MTGTGAASLCTGPSMLMPNRVCPQPDQGIVLLDRACALGFYDNPPYTEGSEPNLIQVEWEACF